MKNFSVWGTGGKHVKRAIKESRRFCFTFNLCVKSSKKPFVVMALVLNETPTQRMGKLMRTLRLHLFVLKLHLCFVEKILLFDLCSNVVM
jgi:hypothetical protein